MKSDRSGYFLPPLASEISNMKRTANFLSVFCFLLLNPASADSKEVETIAVTITPRSPSPDLLDVRLLPSAADLEQGNAAPVMLRITWEQQAFMTGKIYEIRDVSELPFTDAKSQEFPFDHFAGELQRAGRMSDADWEYPLDSDSPWEIMLPDVQGLRNFVGYGMKIWINQRIAKGEIYEACRGVETQLACVRHIGRTPLLVNQLVAASIGNMALGRVEIIQQQPNCPNLYWSLELLPDSLSNYTEALQRESRMLRQSMPSLGKNLPEIGSPQWIKAGDQFIKLMEVSVGIRYTSTEALALQKQVSAHAVTQLKSASRFTNEDIAKMSDSERILRWVLRVNDNLSSRLECVFSLPAPQAIPRLQAISQEITALEKVSGAPGTPFFNNSAGLYVSLTRFDRHVKVLQVIEALRDHAANNDGELATNLSQLRLPAPNDPLTNQPFDYKIVEDTAILRWDTDLPGGDGPIKEYKITVAKPTAGIADSKQ